MCWLSLSDCLHLGLGLRLVIIIIIIEETHLRRGGTRVITVVTKGVLVEHREGREGLSRKIVQNSRFVNGTDPLVVLVRGSN
jgi:hypothetical protein